MSWGRCSWRTWQEKHLLGQWALGLCLPALAGCWRYMYFPTAAKQREHFPHRKIEFYLRDYLRDVEGRQLLLKNEHSQNGGGLLPTSKYFGCLIPGFGSPCLRYWEDIKKSEVWTVENIWSLIRDTSMSASFEGMKGLYVITAFCSGSSSFIMLCLLCTSLT